MKEMYHRSVDLIKNNLLVLVKSTHMTTLYKYLKTQFQDLPLLNDNKTKQKFGKGFGFSYSLTHTV